MKESSGLEKKIKTSKALGLEKEDNDLKGPCWTTWFQGWQNWTLGPTPILQADCISPGPYTVAREHPPWFIRKLPSQQKITQNALPD